VGWMTKVTELLPIRHLHFARKAKNVLTAFAITIKRGEAKH